MDLIWLVPLLPLAGAVALLLAGKRLRPVAGGLASATVAGSFVISVVALVDLLGLPAGDRTHVVQLWDWLAAGTLNVSVDLRVDTLSDGDGPDRDRGRLPDPRLLAWTTCTGIRGTRGSSRT